MTMVSQGLTEAALRQWDSTCKAPTKARGDPPGDVCRDPPGAMEMEINPKLGMTPPFSPPRDETFSTSEENSEEDDYDSELILGEGDEEDDGLFIGANVSQDDDGDGEGDDSTIAFSDIVLPTEEEDPFLQELAEAAVQEAVEQVEQEQAAHVVAIPQGPAVVVAVKESPTEHPNPKSLQSLESDLEEPAEPLAPVTPTFSAHVIVAHAVERKKTEIMNMSQEELLEQLQKRLRPYMKLPPKLPPLRRRKRPNCLFLNHMGTRKAPIPPHRKRKLAAAAAAEVQEPRKKRAMPTLPKKPSSAVPSPVPATANPRTITAPSSPTPVKKSIDVPTPDPVPSTPNTFLPKLLTESESWGDDLINKTPSPRKDTDENHSNLNSPEPSPLPPLGSVENRLQPEPSPTVKSPIAAKPSTPLLKKVKVCPPPQKKKKADAPEEVDFRAQNRSCPSPELAPKKLVTSKKIPRSIYADPPGTTADEVTVNNKRVTPDHLLPRLPPKSPAHSLESSRDDDASVHMHDEPLPLSFEDAFHTSFEDHHDSLASLLADDSHQDHHHHQQQPRLTHRPEAVRSAHDDHGEILPYDLEATPTSMDTNHKESSPEKTVVRIGRVVPPEVLIPVDDMPPLPTTAAPAAAAAASARRGDAPAASTAAPSCPRTPPSNSSKARPYVCLEHRAEGPAPPLLPPAPAGHHPRRVGMPRPMILSPEMDVLSPSARYGSQPRYELPYDDHYSPTSPSVAAHPHHRLPHPHHRLPHPQQRRVVAMRDMSAMREVTPAHQRPIPLGAERLYYRRAVHPAHACRPSPHDDDHHDDLECWDPIPSRCPSSPRAPYVTPDTTMSPGFRKPMVLEPGRDDWVIHRDLPCPPLTGRPMYHPPSHSKMPKDQPMKKSAAGGGTSTKKSASANKPKKAKAPRKKKSETTPKSPKMSATKAKSTTTKSTKTTTSTKKASAKKTTKKSSSNNPSKEPTKKPRASSTSSSRSSPSPPPQVSPVRSQPAPKIDYTEFRKVMSLRSGRTVDHCHMDDDLHGDAGVAAGYESGTSLTDIHLPPLALPAADMQ